MAVWPSGNGVQNQTAGIGYTWVAPAGVTKLTVELWGSGAGGDGGLLANVNGGWGGGGGEYRSSVITNIVPGHTYTITVGAKGTAGGASGGSGGQGNDSTFSDPTPTILVAAKAGNNSANSSTGGTGGTGTTGFHGGNGFQTAVNAGGGGGGSGGTGAVGHNATSATGATAVTGGGNGGTGGTGAVGAAPTTPPGGGGGGGAASGNKAGGAGAAGAGTLTWPTVFTVTFNANSGSGSMSAEQNNQAAALTSNAYTRTGYTFANWNTVAGGGGTTYANGASYAFTASTTLYAQWTINSYDVIFNNNGGTGSMSNETKNYNTTNALTTNTFTRTGYTFTGWNTVADGSGTAYADGANFTWPASNTTLYAQWLVANTTGILAVM